MVIRILLITALIVVAMFLIKKFVEGTFNLMALWDSKGKYDVSKQRHGIVYNKKDKKLEADQSLILPF